MISLKEASILFRLLSFYKFQKMDRKPLYFKLKNFKQNY